MKVSKQDVAETVSRVLSETVLTVAQARIEIANITGKRPEKSTVIRWMTRGADGVRLEAVRLSRDWLTSSEAITRFIIARTEKAIA
jgi:hypothetical protein